MSFDCPNCKNSYSDLQKPRSMHCIHTLSNKPEIKLSMPKKTLKSELTNSIAKANEVFDQIQYLNFVKTQISETSKNHMQISINQIKEEMNKSLTTLVKALNDFIQSIYQQIKITFDSKNEEIVKINNEIEIQVTLRQTLSDKIGDVYKQKTSISDADLDKFVDFDYPQFDLKFETYQLNIGSGNKIFPFEDLIGKIQALKSINYRFNTEDYIKYKDQRFETKPDPGPYKIGNKNIQEKIPNMGSEKNLLKEPPLINQNMFPSISINFPKQYY